MSKITDVSKEDKKMLHSIFFRSFTLFSSFGYTKQGGPGYCFSLMPAINRYYKGREKEKKQALVRNIAFFNTTHPFSTFVMGLTASMEKENSLTDNFDADSINAVKSSLMGPLAGIGDSIFWGTVRIIAAGIAIGMGKAGNIIAPLIFLLLYNIPAQVIRYYGTFLGFNLGTSYIKKIYESGLINVLTKAASIMGLIMIGGMTSAIVTFNSTLKINMGSDLVFDLQKVMDQIFVGIVPLAITLICFRLLNKKVNFNVIMVGIILFSILMAALGIA